MCSLSSPEDLLKGVDFDSEERTRVEAGSNTSTLTLRVVGGDENESLKSETVNTVASPKGLGPENDCAG
jgi:hypothetical protein